ncbi:MAG: 4-hydroxythreonine-4-phosphate dehydrogenase PdxA [Moraxella sp.]
MQKPLLITTGEPAGIGMDIVLDVLVHHADILKFPIIITADKRAFCQRAKTLYQLKKIPHLPNFQTILVNDALYDLQNKITQPIVLIDTPCLDKVCAGVLNPNNAKMVEQQLFLAHHLAIKQQIFAIVTAPIAKSVMIEGGVTLDDDSLFSGHTEYFMQLSGLNKVVMMLANQTMKVALVTTHLPLRDVAGAISADEVQKTVQITHQSLIEYGVTHPKIKVCGLNPHAGENGHLGTEEQEIINPVLQSFQNQGMDISLAMPADTLFTHQHVENTDVIIAMYHDQGLAPLKSHGFGDTVNVTLGLPYIRTSVDHGTALDLAGTGLANSSSLLCAIDFAVKFAKKKKVNKL